MKVQTNLKSGNWLEDAMQAASNLGDQVGGFFDTAGQQAQGFTNSVANTASALWQDLTGLFRR
jgi:ABC-type transporter Mla subunit MlaD